MKSRSKRKRKPARAPFLHRDVEYKFAMFLQDFPPREFNRQFRNMFIEYLVHRRHYNVRLNEEMILEGVWDLIRVLDEAENHWEYRDTDEIIDQYNGK